jgi:hypothetical protein
MQMGASYCSGNVILCRMTVYLQVYKSDKCNRIIAFLTVVIVFCYPPVKTFLSTVSVWK